MRTQLLVSAFAIAILTGMQAHAGILLEPYIGYNFGSYDAESGGGTDAGSYNGLGFGARAGMDFGGVLFAAADFRLNPITVDLDSTTTDADVDYTSLGLVIGADLPLLRVWGGVNFINEFESENGQSTKGTGFKFGVGYEVMPMISLNAEYLINSNSSQCPAGEGNCTDFGANESESLNTIFISVSAPISL